MQREPTSARKIADNKAKTINPIIATALVIRVTTSLLLSSPVVGVGKVWAENFFGTSGPDTIVGTDDDDKIFGKKGNDNLRGEGGDDYIEGNAGDDEIHDGLGSDKIRAGSGNDTIEVEGISEEDGVHHAREDVDIVYGGKGKNNIVNRGESGFRLIFGGDNDDTLVAGSQSNEGRMYGGSGNDEIRAGGDARLEAWGGPGKDTITDFDAAGDTKTADCENFSANESVK